MTTSTPAPSTRFAPTADGAQIAYWVMGRGPALIEARHVQMCHLLREWRIEAVRRWCERMSRSHCLVRFDNRGGGLSRTGPLDFSLEALADDIGSVARALKLEQFALFGTITGCLPAICYAARQPERVTKLVLWSGFARNVDHGQQPRLRSLFEMSASDWELFTESICQAALGWQDAKTAREYAAVLRAATGPEAFREYLIARRTWDVSELLGRITAPTLVLHDECNRLASEERCRELAAGIPGARFMSVESTAGMPGAAAMDVIERFLSPDRDVRPAAVDGLTVRETEVLALLASGASNAAIAARLCISINTVTRHLTHIYAKTGAANRAAAVRFAVERGLVPGAGPEDHSFR
jgi:DNA-binding CsgD family transcriptional regulator/pimeloyl-ACP methyl ester carboxylesterase